MDCANLTPVWSLIPSASRLAIVPASDGRCTELLQYLNPAGLPLDWLSVFPNRPTANDGDRFAI